MVGTFTHYMTTSVCLVYLRRTIKMCWLCGHIKSDRWSLIILCSISRKFDLNIASRGRVLILVVMYNWFVEDALSSYIVESYTNKPNKLNYINTNITTYIIFISLYPMSVFCLWLIIIVAMGKIIMSFSFSNSQDFDHKKGILREKLTNHMLESDACIATLIMP